MSGGLLRRHVRLVASAYVFVIAALATAGFAVGSASIILLAVFLALPSSVVAVPAYYLVYGLLAQIPGANASHSTGSGGCSPEGVCHGATAGDPASWFTVATDLTGAVALIAAAALNVVLVQRRIAARQVRATARPQHDT